MGRFMRWVECKQSPRDLDAFLAVRPPLVVFQQPSENVDSSLPEPFALFPEDLFERVLGQGEALQQITAVEVRRTPQVFCRAAAGQLFEGSHIYIDRPRPEPNAVAVNDQRGTKNARELVKLLSEALPCPALARVRPEPGHELIA
jgi:hypothetical protein